MNRILPHGLLLYRVQAFTTWREWQRLDVHQSLSLRAEQSLKSSC